MKAEIKELLNPTTPEGSTTDLDKNSIQVEELAEKDTPKPPAPVKPKLPELNIQKRASELDDSCASPTKEVKKAFLDKLQDKK